VNKELKVNTIAVGNNIASNSWPYSLMRFVGTNVD
jgi:hypothetical protein